MRIERLLPCLAAGVLASAVPAPASAISDSCCLLKDPIFGTCLVPGVPFVTVCRAVAGPCDVEEKCDALLNCPSNQFKSPSTQCRASAGVCDQAEVCTGSSASCPANQVKAAGTLCRAAAGVCDLAEVCTGGSASCPGDALRPAGFVCRSAASPCDAAESCTGSGKACPADQVLPNGASCESGSACVAGGTCAGGICIGGTSEITFDPAEVTIRNGEVRGVAIVHSGSKGPIPVTGVAVEPAAKFRITAQPAWPQTLATGQRVTVSVALATADPGSHDGKLRVSAQGCADVTLDLTGQVDPPQPPPQNGQADAGGGGCGLGVGGTASLAALAPVAAALRRRRRRG